MPSVVEVLVEAFDKAGTPFIVGIPGEETLEMIEAARVRGMRFILMKQETAGAMMAATWGELTGSPGVCVSTRAPGAANMVLGVTHAWMDRCPLIAITDQFGAAAYASALRQRLDQMALYSPITKWHSSIVAESVHNQARRAIRTAVSGIPGPVQLDLPADQRNREVDVPAMDSPWLPNVVPVRPDRDALKVPLRLLELARRPILLVGPGVLWDKASAQMVMLAERLGAPVMTTPKTKGAIPEDHPLSAGCIFGGLMERSLVSQADLIVAIGLDTVELQPLPWPYSIPVLSITGVLDADSPIPAATELVGHLQGTLDGLAQWAVEGSSWGERVVKAYRAQMDAAVDKPCTGLSPQRVFEVARGILPRDTIATCDVGASRLFSVPKWPVYAPRDYLVSNGIASMGFALPAAMAARMASATRPVIAFTGDGSFMMAIAELHTCVKENLPVIILVQDNASLGVMSLKQDLKGVPRCGTLLGGIDWELLARTFGADGVIVDTENALGDALSAALKSNRTTVIAARMDPSGYIEQYKAMLLAQRATH